MMETMDAFVASRFLIQSYHDDRDIYADLAKYADEHGLTDEQVRDARKLAEDYIFNLLRPFPY